ncbi:hypothetical protein PF006_g27902 [Phytophthora fragariae]|uniref:Uncharacterized protein n=1 Tax=Phytophthora fragariae TaxID=53985 RepID=A0A6A3QK66_9STRA|nr:hypothetical protein PF006_g27902 [Phytophthora fragariae]
MSSRQSPLPSRSSSRTPQRPTLRAPPPASSTRTSRRKTSRSQITPRARSARARAAQTQHLQSVLAMLEDREEARREELDQYPTEPDGNDLDVTSTWSILEGIYRDGDAEAFHHRLLAIGAEIKKKRRQSQDKYRHNMRLRHQMNLDDHPVHDGQGGFSKVSDAESEITQMSLSL